MDFGAVLQTNPPSARTVQLAKLAEEHGFSHVWTFDSHLLWQEPYVIYSKILAETHRIIVGQGCPLSITAEISCAPLFSTLATPMTDVAIDDNTYLGKPGDGKFFKRGLSQYLT